MIDAKALLDDSVERVKSLVEDLRERCDGDDVMNDGLRDEWSEAREVKRTAMSFEEWREDRLTQIAVGWVLSCVFVRFCEDNRLIDVRLSGPRDRLQVAKERYSGFVMEHPSEDQRAYLLGVFGEMQALAATARLFGEHNAVWSPVTPSALACKELLEDWWRLDDAGEFVHDFTDPELDTRFLGDLYQDISADVRDRYALLQTPVFVESFILDRTLDPAIDEFGLDDTDLIDPACGSGHFLLGAFERLFERFWQRDPSGNPVGHAQAALQRIAGVDLNPYAVAIARFRLLVAAIRVCGVKRLADVPAFGLRVAVGDSLLHGTLPGQQDLGVDAELEATQHLYATEDPELVTEILSKTYKAVVGNPPYIQGKDKAARAAYKARYGSCHGKWAMSVPFFERIFALSQAAGPERSAGFVGQITANSFMKREFGSKLVEKYLPAWDLTAVVDTSGAYLPGHGTPTIIVFGRNRKPVGDTVRAAMGLRGEPSTPADPALGLVWSAIEAQVDDPGSTSSYVQVVDWPRGRLHQHPMIFGGGAELWFRVDAQAERRLDDLADAVGITSVTGEDGAFVLPVHSARRLGITPSVDLVVGDELRDWAKSASDAAVWTYNADYEPELSEVNAAYLWAFRRAISDRRRFGTPMLERGMNWWEWQEVYDTKLRVPLSIAFAFVATHGHFVLDRGGKVFKQTAPVIKLPASATEDDHFELLGPLNSSVGCFWMKGVSFNRGDSTDNKGARVTGVEKWIDSFEFAGTHMRSFPVVDHDTKRHAVRLDGLGIQLAEALPSTALRGGVVAVDAARQRVESIRAEMVAVQESLDWRALFDYGLVNGDLSGDDLNVVPLQLGERAFEIVLARRMAAGQEKSTWFERHGSRPITELPTHWSDEYRDLVERRIAAIENDPAGVGFVERPEFKRRWNWEPWDDLLADAVDEWLLDAIEALDLWRSGEVVTVARVAQAARQVEGFAEVAELAGGADVDIAKLVGDLLAGAAVPHVAGLRLKPAGMRKRAQWEQTWELQRAEDAIDARTALDPTDPQFLTEDAAATLKAEQVGSIPKPPNYTSGDMISSVWKHRGKLDVPKERFISYPGAEASDGDTTAVFGWAGWDHAEQGRALASLYVQRRSSLDTDALTCLLGGLWELVPWVKQWHNEPDPRGRRQGDELERFVQTEARSLGITTDTFTGWTPK